MKKKCTSWPTQTTRLSSIRDGRICDSKEYPKPNTWRTRTKRFSTSQTASCSYTTSSAATVSDVALTRTAARGHAPSSCGFIANDCATKLKTYNRERQDQQQIFINDDLTRRRAKHSFYARALKRSKKIADCWTAYGKVMVKDLDNKVSEVKSPSDLLSM